MNSSDKQPVKFSITDMSLEDRPREKFESLGPDVLSVSELLAILIGSGSAKENAVQLMQRVMKDCDGSLATLGRMSIKDLCRYNGMGPAKAITVLAACELGRRRLREDSTHIRRITSATDIYRYFLDKVRDSPVEESHILLLSRSLGILGSKLISRGGITGTVVDVRMILREALLANATQIVLMHNHPSGSTRPSVQDDSLTEKVKHAAETMDIHLLDHVIVTDGAYYSYQEEGRL